MYRDGERDSEDLSQSIECILMTKIKCQKV